VLACERRKLAAALVTAGSGVLCAGAAGLVLYIVTNELFTLVGLLFMRASSNTRTHNPPRYLDGSIGPVFVSRYQNFAVNSATAGRILWQSTTSGAVLFASGGRFGGFPRCGRLARIPLVRTLAQQACHVRGQIRPRRRADARQGPRDRR
jgi:hypothetical protein